MGSRIRRPSPALVIACIALFVAMGGTGYAALKLPKNSVKAKQLAPRSVSSSEAYNLNVHDFRKGVRDGLRGPKGDTGPAGPAGPAGGGATAEAVRLVAPLSSDGNCDDNNPPPSGEFCSGEDQSLWSNYGNGYAPAGFYKDGSGLVHLQGSVTASDNDNGFVQEVVFYLPAGYRPAQKRRFPALYNGGTAGFLEVSPNGAVAPYTAAGAPVAVTAYLALDGIAFRP